MPGDANLIYLLGPLYLFPPCPPLHPHTLSSHLLTPQNVVVQSLSHV